MIFIKNGIIHDAIHRDPFVGNILIENGRISALGPELKTNDDGAEVYDADGFHIYPGFIDAHCHAGLSVAGAASAGKDVNESNDPLTPQLRAIDGIDPFDKNLRKAAFAGVTCVATGPGSANCIGGTFAAIKTYGKRVDNMVVDPCIAMKCAFGENPKSFYQSKAVSSRMTNAALIRTMLKKTQIYKEKLDQAGEDSSKRPAYDEKCEAMLPVIERKIPLKAHAHQANDIFTALRIAKEFNVRITLEHVTDGLLIIDELKDEEVPLALGPYFASMSKIECRNASWEAPGILSKAGCHVCIISDSPVTPLEELPLYAGKAIKAGMDSFEALKAITINPAEHIGAEDRIGSIKAGKDADLVICKGSPFDLYGVIKDVFINGKIITRS